MARARSRQLVRHNKLVVEAAKNIWDLRDAQKSQVPAAIDVHIELVIEHLKCSVHNNARLIWQRRRKGG